MNESKKLMGLLLNLQQDIKAIKKDGTNPHFQSSYYDINSLISVLKPLLKKHGLLIIQPLTHIEGKSAIQTSVICPETGERMDMTTPIPQDANPQKMGSGITYFRRYALASLLLLEAEDDDGNKASKPTKKTDEDLPF